MMATSGVATHIVNGIDKKISMVIDTIRRHQIETYLDELYKRDALTEFRGIDWLVMVNFITARSKDDITATFKDGTEIKA